jgi:hypothetical protein
MANYEIHENVESYLVLVVEPSTPAQRLMLEAFCSSNGIPFFQPDLEEVSENDLTFFTPND